MPATITVAQHVFASLTSEQSPTRRRGYQTCFYTRGLLGADDARAIEERALHRASQRERGKWQFFWLPGGRAVVSHLAAVPEPDEFGRKGRYLAHSLIVSAADWRLLDSNPFALIDEAVFCRTMGRALTLGDLKTGEAAAARVEVNPAVCRERACALSGQWHADELWKLARVACRPLAVTRGGQFVAFVGDDRQVREALEVAFLLPPAPREDCSFDTAAAGCAWPRGVSFWARGFSDEREARTPFVIDAARKKVRLPDRWLDSLPPTPYENFLKRLVYGGQLSTIQKEQRDVSLLSAALEGGPGRSAEALGVAGRVRSGFAEDNRARIEARLDELLPARLPDYIRDKALAQIGRTHVGRLDWLIMNPAGEGLADIFYGIFREWGEIPTEELLLALTPLARGHAGMYLLLALWSRDVGKIQRGLSAMTAEQYRRHVRELRFRPSCPPAYFFSAKHLGDWFDIFVGYGGKLSDIVDGIELTITYGDERDLEALTALAGLLNTDQRRELLKSLEDVPLHKRLKSLKAALQRGTPADPGGPTFGARLFGKRRGGD
ncbi:MAG TPA: hypothetical protein VGB98_08555 [Pyrinomonadaceae bacterium]|jgi:hypothetical protein